MDFKAAVTLCLCLLMFEGLATAQPQSGLKIIVIEGEGAIHDIRRSSAQSPVVEVRDENDVPVAGAKLTFSVPERGPSGTFFGSGASLNVTTNELGRATGMGFRPNLTEGRFQIRVTAVHGGRTGTANISQSNAQSPAAAGVVKTNRSFWRSKTFAILAAGAIAGAIVATRGGDDAATPSVPPTTITPGTVSVGTPR